MIRTREKDSKYQQNNLSRTISYHYDNVNCKECTCAIITHECINILEDKMKHFTVFVDCRNEENFNPARVVYEINITRLYFRDVVIHRNMRMYSYTGIFDPIGDAASSRWLFSGKSNVYWKKLLDKRSVYVIVHTCTCMSYTYII